MAIIKSILILVPSVQFYSPSFFIDKNTQGPGVLKPEFGVVRENTFLPLLHGGRVSEKSLGVSTLQAAEPPYSVNNDPIK